MQCPTCASPLPVGAMICGECGRTLSGVDTSAPEASRSAEPREPAAPAWPPRRDARSSSERPWWVREPSAGPSTDDPVPRLDAPPAWAGDSHDGASEASPPSAESASRLERTPEASVGVGDVELAPVVESAPAAPEVPRPSPAPLREPTTTREDGRRPSSAPLWTASLTPITSAGPVGGDSSSGELPVVVEHPGAEPEPEPEPEPVVEPTGQGTAGTRPDDDSDGAADGHPATGGSAADDRADGASRSDVGEEAGPARDRSRAVVPAPGPGDTVRVEPIRDSTEPRDDSEDAPVPLVEPGTAGQAERCTQCGAEVHEDDIFCGVCGAVVQSVALSFTGPIVPFLRKQAAEHGDRAEGDVSAADVMPSADHGGPLRRHESSPGVVSPEDAPDDVPPADAPDDATSSEPAPQVDARELPDLPPLPEPAWPSRAQTAAAATDEDDVDETRIVRRGPVGAPFVLQFSTGESFTVDGTGLVGRAPTPQPGERFDQLIRIVDPGRSVSKTHLEFGQDDGHLWLSDRWSGNGTIVRPRDQRARRLEPGTRVRVARGSRVDIGEQYFVVG